MSNLDHIPMHHFSVLADGFDEKRLHSQDFAAIEYLSTSFSCTVGCVQYSNSTSFVLQKNLPVAQCEVQALLSGKLTKLVCRVEEFVAAVFGWV